MPTSNEQLSILFDEEPPTENTTESKVMNGTDEQVELESMPGLAIRVENSDNIPALAAFAKQQYLDYAISVVVGRALPSVSDGLKPVHRRIMYAMFKMGLHKSPKHVKCARVVGEVLGKYHPHGDSSVYDALVRMAQSWSLRYPLVDGQGNFGSLDGDNAAAMRYTESKQRPIADLLLSEIDEDTVDFIPNYDGEDIEPTMLPSRLPIILLNGASGIAVGMATEIPSHNLREIAHACIQIIKNPTMNDESIHDLIPGPDFPGGAQIISTSAEIRAAMSGKGSIRVRAKWEVEKLARGQWQIAISELPPSISIAGVMSEIDARSNPQPKMKGDKKSYSPADLNLKASFLSAIDGVRDESDKNHGTRLVIEPKSSRDLPDEIMRLLLAYTSLEINVPVNMNLLGLNKKPKTQSIGAILREWCNFRMITVTRRTNHRLSVAEKRIHILEGRMSIIMDIDKAIRIIRAAEEPKAELMKEFGLSEIQADDVLEIRLRQLARLEGIKIGDELKKLQSDAAYLRHLLSSEVAMRELISSEIENDAKLYGDDRRTQIETSEKVTAQDAKAIAMVNDPVTVIISKHGWLRTRQGHSEIDPSQLIFRSGDSLMKMIQCRTTDNLSVLDQNGRVYTIEIGKLPGGKGDGSPLTSIVDLHEGGKMVFAEVFGHDDAVLVATNGGYGFRCKGSDLVSRNKAGKAFLSVPEGEMPVTFCLAPADDQEIACVTKDGRCLIFKMHEFKFLPRGRGLKLIDAEPGNNEMLSIELDLNNIEPSRVDVCRSSRGGKGRSIFTSAGAVINSNKKSSSGSLAPLTVVVTQNDEVLIFDGHDVNDAELGFQYGFEGLHIMKGLQSDYLAILDQNGRVYTVGLETLNKKEGTYTLGSLVDFYEGGKRIFTQVFSKDDAMLVATNGGYGFQCAGADLIARNRNGKAFLTIQEGEEAVVFMKSPALASDIACITEDGRGLVFSIDEIKFLPKGRGLKLIEAAPGPSAMISIIDDFTNLDQERVTVCRSSRGGKGRQIK